MLCSLSFTHLKKDTMSPHRQTSGQIYKTLINYIFHLHSLETRHIIALQPSPTTGK